jgi:hypothetical protein
VIDLLKGYFKIGDRDDHREMRAKVLGRVLGLDRALEPCCPRCWRCSTCRSRTRPGRTWTHRSAASARWTPSSACCLRESQVRPLLVVFEDLHWIDGETQALLDSLVESLGSARLLLLVNYRPEYEHRWGSKTPTPSSGSTACPPRARRSCWRRCSGRTRAGAPDADAGEAGQPVLPGGDGADAGGDGALAGERGAYRLTRPVEALQVPATVQTILAARIDRLPPEEKRLLQAASVIGKDVPYALLAAIAEQPEEHCGGDSRISRRRSSSTRRSSSRISNTPSSTR